MYLIRCDVKDCDVTQPIRLGLSPVLGGAKTGVPKGWGVVFRIRALDDVERKRVLTHHAQRSMGPLPFSALEAVEGKDVEVADHKVFRVCPTCMEKLLPPMKDDAGDEPLHIVTGYV